MAEDINVQQTIADDLIELRTLVLTTMDLLVLVGAKVDDMFTSLDMPVPEEDDDDRKA